MDREEARCLLIEKLAKYRQMSYGELVGCITDDQYLEVLGPTNTEYQIEIQFMWDSEKDGDIRVSAAIDDGSFRHAFRPVCADFIMTPDGRYVGE